MEKERHFFARMMEQTAFGAAFFPGQPIVEIAGERRVLIENHQGVTSYGKNRILVKTSYGLISVCGCDLQMMHMTKERLVICGRIDSVGLQRRG